MELSLKEADGQWDLTITTVLDFVSATPRDWIMDPELLSKWLPFAVLSLVPEVGGAITVRNPDGSLGNGIVTTWDVAGVVGFRIFADGRAASNQDNIIVLDFVPNLYGRDVTVIQRIANPHIAAMVAIGWDACISALYHADRNEPIPLMPPDVSRFEDFVAQLGLDAPALESIPGGTRIKFDRQTLMQPVEKFWSVMTAGLNLRVGDFAPPTFTGAEESGRISIVSPPGELEYLTSDGGRVKWRLHEHFGSTRINLQIAVPRSVDADALSSTWQEHLGAVVSRVIAAD